MREDQRRDTRDEATAASAAAASTAACGPCSSSSMKMNTSPALKAVLVRGTRMGKKAAATASRMPVTT
jgi:hypothetical protein